MELVFVKDVLKKDGTVRFKRGENRDYPKSTWNEIAKAVGKKLSAIALPSQEAFAKKEAA